MELLSPPIVSALQACAEEATLTDQQFRAITEYAISSLLNVSSAERSDALPHGVDPLLLKYSIPSITTLLLESSRTDLSTDQFILVIDDCKFAPAKKEILQKVYHSYKQKIREKLTLVGNDPPHVVDVGWRLDYNLKHNQSNRVMQLQYTVALKTEQQSCEQDSFLQFSCNREQLQEFVGKLKEAAKSVEKLAES